MIHQLQESRPIQVKLILRHIWFHFSQMSINYFVIHPIICSVVHVAWNPISMVGDGLDSGENIYPNFPDFTVGWER